VEARDKKLVCQVASLAGRKFMEANQNFAHASAADEVVSLAKLELLTS